MSVRADLFVSLDGFGTGEDQSVEAPFGHAGFRLVERYMNTATVAAQGLIPVAGAGTTGVDDAFAGKHFVRVGTEIMGAGKFGPPGWQDDPDWRGWWGEDPPFGTPVFVLTHRPRPALEMDGGTTFHFLDASPQEALTEAVAAAGDLDVMIGGGPTTTRQFLAAGLVDHLYLGIAPIVLGRGVRLWDGLEDLQDDYEVETVSSPSGMTHLTFSRRAAVQ